MSKLKIENKKLKEFPIFPIYGNVQKDEEFYIASIIFPLNLNDDQTIKFENVLPRLYFISIQNLSNNYQYDNNKSVYPYPPTSCGLQLKNDVNLGKIPPFTSTDFIFSENLENISTFSSNDLYSKNVNLKLKNNNIFQNITVNSIYKQGNNIYSDLFSVNSNFKFSSVDLYTSNNLIKGTCNEIYNFVFIPKDLNYTYIQGLIYTGLPMVIYYGSKSQISDGSTYYPMHARYSLTCKSKSQCDNIIPNETQLNECYNNYINGDVSYICNLNGETSTVSSNDIVREKTSNRAIDNNNIDYLNYYIIPKRIYDKNGISVDGLTIAISFFNFLIGKQSDYVENTSYYTKSIADNGIPKNTNFLFKYCNNEEYFNPLADDCKNDEVLSALYHYLIEEVNDENIDFQKTRPITSIYKKLQRINLSNPIKFLMSLKFEYSKYKVIEYHNINTNILYCDYKQFCEKCKYETFSRDNFESKITEHSNNGIVKGLYNRNKIFKFYKIEFEEYIKKFEALEDLPDFGNDEFIDEE